MVEVEAAKRGGLLGGLGMVTSILVPGPFLLGAVPAIVIVIYANKRLSGDVPLAVDLRPPESGGIQGVTSYATSFRLSSSVT
jgi:hypothetical protein